MPSKNRKAKAENIGTIPCPTCQEIAAVKKRKDGKLMVYCGDCGQLHLNLAGGQDYIMENATLFGPDGPGPDVPEWISTGKAWKRDRHYGEEPKEPTIETVTLDPEAPAPEPGPEPGPPAPEPGAKSGQESGPEPEPPASEPEQEQGKPDSDSIWEGGLFS